ncbi:DnaJ-domain-containing protein [Dothidotthia symphoricarpi CBS 119687]|uniref:DnaJ-domain-containing protein n=1 Tax=Dothidotthia symphoricarpi CBS 119687 TaxID=1392245 RepID=A0A6A6AGX8_9PLEO|nr:DnaJ-domain-containing protein [Dothidotthia symphoricarpi CBS 119687]KAF2130826.1 DnaJ-domain-containing protein [Dothidotthia symphoricarpi CBS 119687]
MAVSAPTEDHYSVLEILPGATLKEIKTAYRRLARLYHPDKNNGSQTSTLRTQQINAAWEILKDSSKRKLYDRLWPRRESQSKDSRPDVTKPTSTAHWRWQSSPRPSPTSEHNARARAQSHKQRQAWLHFEKAQEAGIRQSRKHIHSLQSEISALAAKLQSTTRHFAVHVQWRAGIAMNTDELQRQMLQAEAMMKLRQQQLQQDESRLGRLELDLLRRRGQEYARLAAERKEERQWEAQEEQLRQEKLAKERVEAEAQKQRDTEWDARMEEVRQRMRNFTEKQAHLADEAKKAEAAEQRRMAEDRATEEQIQKRKLQEEANKKMEPEGKCGHESSWDRCPGPIDCTYCAWPPSTYAFRCPDCQILACLFCMTTLKAGCEPADYKSFWQRNVDPSPSAEALRFDIHADSDDDFNEVYYDCQDDFDDDDDSEYFDCREDM